MLSRLRAMFAGGKPAETKAPATQMVRGRYDAAQLTESNRRHWAFADAMSADAAASPEIRRILRNRARYEAANNGYARGMIDTLAMDTIGRGPRLQCLTKSEAANERLEAAFADWSKAIDLTEKLRLMRVARAESGEVFAVFITNPALPTAVKLDIRIIEADQVTTPDLSPLADNVVDGIKFDDAGNPASYTILKHHPGDSLQPGFGNEYDVVPASEVLHYFRATRPGQSRGIPDITPALPLYGLLRRYTLACIAAAERAADFAAVIYTDSPADGQSDELVPLDSIELEHNTMTTLPAGWKMGQVEAEHPTTTYSDFKREILNEIARVLGMPYNIAAGNSSTYNYASGRLDHQGYFKTIEIEQEKLEREVIDRVLLKFCAEAVLAPGVIPVEHRSHVARRQLPPHAWFWDGFEHVDPAKEAKAQETRLGSGTTTLAREYAKDGLDWRKEIIQRSREIALMKSLGMDPAPAKTPAKSSSPEGGDDE